MTEKLLRDCLKEAQKKSQVGLLIWPNWTQWSDYSFLLKKGNETYDFALAQVTKGEEATIPFKWNGLTLPGIIAVSAEKMLSSYEFFNHVLKLCEDKHYTGPITLIPINEVSESC